MKRVYAYMQETPFIAVLRVTTVYHLSDSFALLRSSGTPSPLLTA